MVRLFDQRKYFRFPAYDDKDGVKVFRENRRYLFEDERENNSPAPENTKKSRPDLKREERSRSEEKDFNHTPKEEINSVREENEIKINIPKRRPLKVNTSWEMPEPSQRSATNQSAPSIAQTEKKERFKEEIENKYQPSYIKKENPTIDTIVKATVNEKQKKTVNRVNKNQQLEKKLATTRFAEPGKKFQPRSIPQQLHHEDESNRWKKAELANQMFKSKENFLLFGKGKDIESLPELVDKEQVTVEKQQDEASMNQSAKTTSEVIVRPKRKIPEVPQRDFGGSTINPTKTKSEPVNIPAIARKRQETASSEGSMHTRLEKSLSGIISEEGSQLRSSKYFD